MTRWQYADVYVRISIDRPNATALVRQEVDCRTWATQEGLTVRQVHTDAGRSAYDDRARDGLESALVALTAGVVDTLVVWKLDRLSRRGVEAVAAMAREVEAVGARIVFLKDGLETTDPSSRAALRVIAAQARVESVDLGLRVGSAKDHLRRQGRWIGGSPPFGYVCRDGRLHVDRENGPVVREMVARVLAGASLVSVTRWLNDSRVPAPRGGSWAVGSVAQLLRAPAMAGLAPETLRHADGRYSSTVVPWLHPDTGQPVSVMADGESPLLQPGRRDELLRTIRAGKLAASPRSSRGGHLLTGLLLCAACGGRASAAGNSYRCDSVRLGRRCSAPAGGYEPAVDGAVTAAFMDRVNATRDDQLLVSMAERMLASRSPALAARRGAVLLALQDLDAVVNENVPGSGGRAAETHDTERAQARRAELTSKLVRYPLPMAAVTELCQPSVLHRRWRHATVQERRDLLSYALDEVRLSRGTRGRRFVPAERLVFRWAEPVQPGTV